jgi:hypothetical protein
MTAHQVIQGAVGSKGTTFLTGSCILAHLEDGESISPVPVDVEFWSHHEFARAVRELQAQHHDMLLVMHEHLGEHDHLHPVDDECVGCKAEALFDKWEADRVPV